MIDIKTSTVPCVNLRFLGSYRVDSDQDPLLGDTGRELGIVYIGHWLSAKQAIKMHNRGKRL